ncbi:MAG: hypothetical protein JWO90_2320 [Solirubrobacterales bacterium]|jgi:hypothetical protein|nr:hypothetical protein [Solirubrobacterales bacterium]
MNVKIPSALLIAGALAFGVAACGDDEETTSAATPAASTASETPEPAAKIDSLTGTSTKVTLDAGFVEALTSLKVTPGPVGDATISSGGVATFPITGGNVTYYTPGSVSPYVQGLINHDGSGLSLEAGGKLVELENFDVDPGKSVLTGDVSVDGTEAVADAPLFFLDGRTLQPLRTNEDGSKAVLEGTTVKLKQEAADLLNETFGIDTLEAGLVIGVAKITVNTGA